MDCDSDDENKEEYEYEYDDNDQEEYSYSDAEEKDYKTNTDVAFNVPDCGYIIEDYKKLLPMLNGLINQISSLLSVEKDVAESLLFCFLWNKEMLVDSYYNDPEKVMIKAGFSPTKGSIVTDHVCPICGDSVSKDQMYMLSCGHQFCRDCYSQYLEVNVREGQACVALCCPQHKCTHRIPLSTYEQLLSSHLYEKYKEYLTKNFIERSSTMSWCTSPIGCSKVAIGSGISMVKCTCKYIFCFRCGEEGHNPASCENLMIWNEKCKDESETANWILANTKKCSKCNTRIEKNQGCNHMTCVKCKHEFCWICLLDWKEHGQNSGGYYKCNKYDSTNVDKNATKAKAELDRYLFYYQRYHEHNHSLKFANKQREMAESKMIQLQEQNKSNAWMDVQYLTQGVEQVIECRRVLKYTYVHGHFLKDNSNEKMLFEHHQEMLEKHTEKLSELTEMNIPLNNGSFITANSATSSNSNNVSSTTMGNSATGRSHGASSSSFMTGVSSASASASTSIKSTSSTPPSSVVSSSVPAILNSTDHRTHIINLTRVTEKFITSILQCATSSYQDDDLLAMLVHSNSNSNIANYGLKGNVSGSSSSGNTGSGSGVGNSASGSNIRPSSVNGGSNNGHRNGNGNGNVIDDEYLLRYNSIVNTNDMSSSVSSSASNADVPSGGASKRTRGNSGSKNSRK